MRPLLLLPVLLCTLACSSKLERSKAEELIRKDYPVFVAVIVPEHTSVEKGSSADLRLVALKANLDRTGWFDAKVEAVGTQENFTFRLKPDAPKDIKADPRGFAVPAAEAAFVKAVRMEPTREGARVTYTIRLEKPTAQFPIFQGQHPDVRVGAEKQRHATFERQHGSWVLTGTDETLRKAE